MNIKHNKTTLLTLASKSHLSLVVQFYFSENKPGYLKVMVPEGFGQYHLLLSGHINYY